RWLLPALERGGGHSRRQGSARVPRPLRVEKGVGAAGGADGVVRGYGGAVVVRPRRARAPPGAEAAALVPEGGDDVRGHAGVLPAGSVGGLVVRDRGQPSSAGGGRRVVVGVYSQGGVSGPRNRRSNESNSVHWVEKSDPGARKMPACKCER